MLIVSDGKKNSIKIYTEEPVFVIRASRDDLMDLKDLDETNSPGVYVLIGGNNRYVGQSGASILNRILSHDRDKEWWDELIMFGKQNTGLDKSQTEHLERTIIEDYKTKTGYILKNKTPGTISYCNPLMKISAEKVWVY